MKPPASRDRKNAWKQADIFLSGIQKILSRGTASTLQAKKPAKPLASEQFDYFCNGKDSI